MTARLTRIVVTFAVVLTAYWLYAQTAVPLIEPPPLERVHTPLDEEAVQNARTRPGRYQKLFAAHFPQGHWALGTPKVLQSPHGMLLFQDWLTLKDQRVELSPCAMIFFPQSRAGDDALPDGAVVLEAPEGALVQFDEEFDLTRGKIGKIVDGQLVGPITITSRMDPNDPDDDLVITTENVQINQRLIRAASSVQFRLGPNYGHGSDMEIRLFDASDKTQRGTDEPNIGGIQSFHLAYNVEVHLELGGGGLLPGIKPPETAQPTDPRDRLAHPKKSSPIEITCQGPFHFDALNRVATFEEAVDVLRVNPEGPSDTLSCELLTIFFTEKTDPKPSGADAADGALASFEPYSIKAQGHPVVVRSPSTGSFVRTPFLQYELGPEGELGTLTADGPGAMSATGGDDPSERFEGSWQDKLLLRPDGDQHVLSLLGRPELKMTGSGSITADEFHLWLARTREHAMAGAQDKHPTRYLPDRMKAEGEVRIESPALFGAVDRLEVWFEHTLHHPVARSGGTARTPLISTKQPKRRYEVTGHVLQANVAVRGRRAEVSDLTLDGNVDFRETTPAGPDAQPLVVRGDRLVVEDVDSPATEITIVGAPAHVEARGITADGGNIHLHRGKNQLWIEGPGRMSMPIPGNLASDPLAAGEPQVVRPGAAPKILTVTWQRQMNFDGRTIRFDKSVVAYTPDQRLLTEQLEVTLTQTIRFDDISPRDSTARDSQLADVQEIVCRGGVLFDGRSTDRQGRPSQQRIEAQNLSIHHTTGEIHVEGPGSVESVRLGSGNPLGSRPARPATGASDAKTRLEYLRVDFQRHADGNLHDREITFHEAGATYGPVDRWDDRVDVDAPAGLGAEGMMLTSDTLTVSQAPAAANGDRPIELVAQGNATAEGRQFTARAQRMTYAQAKDLIVLEGTGRIDAQLWRQVQVGSPTSHVSARRILFWPTRNEVQVEGSRYLNLSQIGAGPRVPRASTP